MSSRFFCSLSNQFQFELNLFTNNPLKFIFKVRESFPILKFGKVTLPKPLAYLT